MRQTLLAGRWFPLDAGTRSKQADLRPVFMLAVIRVSLYNLLARTPHPPAMLDFQQVRQQIHAMGEHAPLREAKLRALRERANRLLDEYANAGEALADKVRAAARQIPGLRCARPEQEALDLHQPPPDTDLSRISIIAADGSQINPNRHAPVAYYLINAGAICLFPGEAPQEWVRSQLHYGDDLYPGGTLISEGAVALQRDVAERTALLALVEGAPHQGIITLTDGPLELWGAKGRDESGSFRQALQRYLAALRGLHRCGAVTAGYVDKPRADLVLRLLELAAAPEGDLRAAVREGAFLGITDWALFAHRLGPGERSAVFGLQSQSEQEYTGPLGLHFFYLNVGRAGKPYLARVEIPRWVAQDAVQLGRLHAVLVYQARLLGERAYPYLLHRAHEVAVVRREEQEQLTNMIVLELLRQGVPVEGASHKQAVKDTAR